MGSEEWKAPAKVEELYAKTNGNQFAGVNRPTAGARELKAVGTGEAPYQLYSLATPNGMKVNILLEELGVAYDAHRIGLSGEQFTSGFTDINPNGKIPALLDQSDKKNPINLFESGSILLHLADKHKKFIPSNEEPFARAQVINWLMWQMGTGPYFGQFGHFYKYAPKDQVQARDYGVARYGMEVQRCLSLLDQTLEKSKSGYITDWGYSIADMAIWPWVRCLSLPNGYNAADFLSLDSYKHVTQWVELVGKRPAAIKSPLITKI